MASAPHNESQLIITLCEHDSKITKSNEIPSASLDILYTSRKRADEFSHEILAPDDIDEYLITIGSVRASNSFDEEFTLEDLRAALQM